MAKLPPHLMVISFVVFISLNLVENLIHFSIGRNVENQDNGKVEFKMPSVYDLMKIVVIMILFGILQAFFTYIAVKGDL
jgi:hypothetical protein